MGGPTVRLFRVVLLTSITFCLFGWDVVSCVWLDRAWMFGSSVGQRVGLGDRWLVGSVLGALGRGG